MSVSNIVLSVSEYFIESKAKKTTDKVIAYFVRKCILQYVLLNFKPR